jgi:hypothetical protein
MSATGQMRGHPVTWDGEHWRYEDGVVADGLRPCVKCGLPPTSEGYDSCIGFVPGAASVCCGHGIEAPYFVGNRAEPRPEILDWDF